MIASRIVDSARHESRLQSSAPVGTFYRKVKTHIARLAKPLAIIPQVQAAFRIFVLITLVIGQTSIWLPLLISTGKQNITFADVLDVRFLQREDART